MHVVPDVTVLVDENGGIIEQGPQGYQRIAGTVTVQFGAVNAGQEGVIGSGIGRQRPFIFQAQSLDRLFDAFLVDGRAFQRAGEAGRLAGKADEIAHVAARRDAEAADETAVREQLRSDPPLDQLAQDVDSGLEGGAVRLARLDHRHVEGIRKDAFDLERRQGFRHGSGKNDVRAHLPQQTAGVGEERASHVALQLVEIVLHHQKAWGAVVPHQRVARFGKQQVDLVDEIGRVALQPAADLDPARMAALGLGLDAPEQLQPETEQLSADRRLSIDAERTAQRPFIDLRFRPIDEPLGDVPHKPFVQRHPVLIEVCDELLAQPQKKIRIVEVTHQVLIVQGKMDAVEAVRELPLDQLQFGGFSAAAMSGKDDFDVVLIADGRARTQRDVLKTLAHLRQMIGLLPAAQVDVPAVAGGKRLQQRRLRHFLQRHGRRGLRCLGNLLRALGHHGERFGHGVCRECGESKCGA